MSDGGFVRLPYELIDSGRMSITEMSVYIALLRHRDHTTGRCWPSYATIAHKARVTRRTAITAVRSLQEMGVVKIYSDPHRPNVYEVALFDAFPKPPKGDSKGGDKGASNPTANPSEAVASDPLGGETISPGGETVALGGETISPEGCNSFTSSGETVAPEVEPLNSNHELAPSNEKHERAITSAVPADDTPFEFTVETKLATGKQIKFLTDLYLLHVNETPPKAQVDQWRKSTTEEAHERIAAWMKSMPRGTEYVGPEDGDDTYNRLSTIGQDWADRKFIPDGAVS